MCEHGKTVDLEVKIPAAYSDSGKDEIKIKPVDSCIAPIVDALNRAEIYTICSCCGHGELPGQIDLEDDRVLTVFSKEQFQDEWSVVKKEHVNFGWLPWDEDKVPRDGSGILALHPNRVNVQFITWNESDQMWYIGGSFLPLPTNTMPTHYMIIPEFPEVT
jgi:hypothetical protein